MYCRMLLQARRASEWLRRETTRLRFVLVLSQLVVVHRFVSLHEISYRASGYVKKMPASIKKARLLAS